jgi:hypothetical protein
MLQQSKPVNDDSPSSCNAHDAVAPDLPLGMYAPRPAM